jgi:hypothetical protein
MTTRPNGDWFTCLSRCDADVPCGSGRHVIRWEAGTLRLDSHPDPEAELVLAALGGEKARCVEVAEAWARHAADLTLLSVGPRDLDGVVVSWEDVDEAAQAGLGVAVSRGGILPATGSGQGPVRRPSAMLASAMVQASARRTRLLQEHAEARQRRTDLLSLFALGPAFQVRLAAQVVAAHASRVDEPGDQGISRRSVLVSALEGRLALVAERWLGIDPGYVKASLHAGPGWGAAELTGRGEQRRLRVSLPADWLARVWASGLALAGRHLVVAVDRGGWPDARVLALPAPGAEPVLLDVHARHDPPASPDGERPDEESTAGGSAAGDGPHWEI